MRFVTEGRLSEAPATRHRRRSGAASTCRYEIRTTGLIGFTFETTDDTYVVGANHVKSQIPRSLPFGYVGVWDFIVYARIGERRLELQRGITAIRRLWANKTADAIAAPISSS